MRVMGDILAEAKDTMQNNYKCAIELRDPMVAKVFAVSKRAQEELPNFPQDLREAISLGRMALDPAVEVAQLFNQDDDVLCLQLSPFQTLLRKDKIKEGLKIALEEEMQYQMCEIGVDINKCVAYPHQGKLFQASFSDFQNILSTMPSIRSRPWPQKSGRSHQALQKGKHETGNS